MNRCLPISVAFAVGRWPFLLIPKGMSQVQSHKAARRRHVWQCMEGSEHADQRSSKFSHVTVCIMAAVGVQCKGSAVTVA